MYNNKTAAGASFSGAQVSMEPMERLRSEILGLHLVLKESYKDAPERVQVLGKHLAKNHNVLQL